MVLLKTVTNREEYLILVGKGLKALPRFSTVEQQGTQGIAPYIAMLIGTLNLEKVGLL